MANPDGEREILAADLGSIRVVTLSRPHTLNAFTSESYRLLEELLGAADDDPGVAVILLEGAGRAFSSGVDLVAFRDGDVDEYRVAFAQLVARLVDLRKPLVAAVNGVAVGFGATLLLHCDVVVIADGARLRFPFTELGTAPEAGSSLLLPAIVGAQRASEMILTARWVSAAEAVDAGLAARRVPDGELGDAARAVAAEIARHPVEATVAAKRLLKTSAHESVPGALRREADAGQALSDELGGLPSDLGR